jgi:hypothetical protein
VHVTLTARTSLPLGVSTVATDFEHSAVDVNDYELVRGHSSPPRVGTNARLGFARFAGELQRTFYFEV